METLNNQTIPSTYEELPALFNAVRDKIFPNFPIFNEEHRIPLENLIMGRFLNREICTVPYARWQFMFNQKLMEIMPYFNKLYQALESQPDFNMFDDVNYTRTIKTDGIVTMNKGTSDTSTGTNEQEANGTFNPGTESIVTESNTPQTELDNFLENKYVSGASKSVNSGEDTSYNKTTFTLNQKLERSGSDSDVEDRMVTETVLGKRGNKSYVELIKEYRESLFTVDNMVLDALEDMFFMIY